MLMRTIGAFMVFCSVWVAGGCGESPPKFGFDDTDTHTEADLDSDTLSDDVIDTVDGTGTDTSSDTAGETDSVSDTEQDKITDTIQDTETASESESESETASESESESESGSETASESATDFDSDSGTAVDSDTASDSPSPCGPDAVDEQQFAAGQMVGCAGMVTWNNAVNLCGKERYLCDARDWVALRQGQAPLFNYWTADELLWGGQENHCWVDENEGTQCPPGQPMKVCAGHEDPLGNLCIWINCGYGKNSKDNDYFGGCENGTTAGALCCL